MSTIKTIETLFRFLDEETKDQIKDYIIATKDTQFITFQNQNQINNLNSHYMSMFYNYLSEEELLDLRNYTGYNFKSINAILRNNWNYEKNGLLTDELKNQIGHLSERISNIIQKSPNIEYDFTTFRGVTLSTFKNYGINTLEELTNLSGKYLYEEGFTSTSMLEETSYFNKQIDNKEYNVEIKYKISYGFEDGIFLFNDDMTYSTNQLEYLIDKNTLSYVEDVTINKNNNSAIITVITIPKKIWSMPKETKVRT